jgi:hypothetical protein
VPEISRFYGIVIYMYAETGGQHHRPHFHARYQENEAVYSIDEPTALAGGLPPRPHRLVQAWAEIHNPELRENWRRLLSGQSPARIAPLE